jgi:predicted nucleic acid-binding protein
MAAARTVRAAYVDTSCLVAIAFGEADSKKLAKRLAGYEAVFASGLLEAELKAALRREGVAGNPLDFLPGLDWVYPSRPLTAEIDRVLEAGYVRGADAWHLACALYLGPGGSELRFETLDSRQRAVAEKIGFA